MNLFSDDDYVTIRLPCRTVQGFLMPHEHGQEVVEAVFRRMTVGLHSMILSLCKRQIVQDIGQGVEKMLTTDIDDEEYNTLVLRYALYAWTLCPLHHEDQCLTDESFAQVCRHPSPVVRGLTRHYHETYIMTQDEIKELKQQAMILFGKNSKGVAHPCDAVSFYCMLTVAWEKFGLNYFDLKKLPQRQYMMLRLMIEQETERHRAEARSEQNRGRSKIVGPMARGRHRTQTITNPE